MTGSRWPMAAAACALTLSMLATANSAAQDSVKQARDHGARLLADAKRCNIDRATETLLAKKITDRIWFLSDGDSSMRCTRDPNCGGDVDFMMAVLCKTIPCLGEPPPPPAPNCAMSMPRLKAMRIMTDQWRPADGLK